MSIAEEIRSNTKKDLAIKLKAFGKCALIRCTGFGKTWLLAELTKDYKKVLYLYPADVIKETVVQVVSNLNGTLHIHSDSNLDCENIKFMTYAKIARVNYSDTSDRACVGP